MGPEVTELERQLADFVGVDYAVSCSSGTDALLMALMSFGIKAGDGVFTSPFTFVATAEVIRLLGATPVFVDIDPETFNLDAEKLERAIWALKKNDSSAHPLPRFPGSEGLCPRCVIAVDLFGLPADYAEIERVAKSDDLFIIQDAAQSFGAEYKGRKACRQGDIGCTSFFPAKPLGGYGDGGMCFTNDEMIAGLLESIRIHGQGSDKYDNVRIGINGRLDTLQAAVLLAKFTIFPDEIEARQIVADRYSNLLRNSGLSIPEVPADCKSVWAQYSVLAKDRLHKAGLQKRLKQAGIPTAVYYPKPLHQQEAFLPLGYQKGDFPVSEDASQRIFSLPMHPYLSAADQQTIAGILNAG